MITTKDPFALAFHVKRRPHYAPRMQASPLQIWRGLAACAEVPVRMMCDVVNGLRHSTSWPTQMCKLVRRTSSRAVRLLLIGVAVAQVGLSKKVCRTLV